jgi:putative ABC transport system permease protein
MEFGPILSALKHHKTGTILVALQISVSIAIIVNAMFIINQRVEKMDRDTGMDTNNIIVTSIRTIDDDDDVGAMIARDLEALRALPQVLDATIINQVPLSGSGSSTGMRSKPDENLTAVATGRYKLDDHGLETLGANLVRGRNFYPEEIITWVPGTTENSPPAVVIMTQALADKLLPDEDALGKTVYWYGMEPATIIGIVDHMQGAWISWDGLDRNVYQPGITASQSVKYMIRAKTGERDKLLPLVEEILTGLKRDRVIRYVKTHEDIIKRSYTLDKVMTYMLGVVIVLLVSLTALVIVGLASYMVNQRTKQIGTRRALGATRLDIIRYFLVENWIITTFGAIGGCLLTVAVGYWLETSFELPRLDYSYLLVTVVSLWVLSQMAAYFPALRAANIAPAIATRTV